jgi:hypothetical protein
MKKAGFAVLALAATAGIGYAAGVANAPDIATLNARAFKYVLPDKIDWRPAEGLQGTDAAVMVGDPTKPGFYVVLNRFHPGNFSRPHYHENDRYIMVISGNWWVDTGGKFDPNRTVPIRPGTFVTHPGREVHYDGARAGTEEAIVMIFGQGPGSRHECEGPRAETGPGPCADARRAAGLN